MPALATHRPVDLYELLQNSRIAACAFRGKTCREVVMTINAIVVLIIRIVGPEERRTDRTREMFNVVFLFYREVRWIHIVTQQAGHSRHARM
jgi:hypothetical protein